MIRVLTIEEKIVRLERQIRHQKRGAELSPIQARELLDVLKDCASDYRARLPERRCAALEILDERMLAMKNRERNADQRLADGIVQFWPVVRQALAAASNEGNLA